MNLINNVNFKLTEIPKFHPIANKYERLEFFKLQKKRCIEGYWVGGKWMPPELYYYTNFHKITIGEAVNQKLALPYCRDIEWERAYFYAEATGFSGFEFDDEYSCNRFLDDPEITDDDLMHKCDTGGVRDIKFYNNLFNKNGKRKKYVPFSAYMDLCNKDLGKPLYYNSAKHIIEVGPRGYGKTFWLSALIAHNFIFSGARDYDYYLDMLRNKTPLKSLTVVGAIDTKYSQTTLNHFKNAFDSYPGDEKVELYGETYIDPSPLKLDTFGSLQAGKIFTARRTGSEIKHVTFADNPLAANGGRPNRIFIDEVGFANNIKEIWGAIEATQTNEEFKRLTVYATGTGGLTSSGAVTYVKDIFYNPEAWGCMAIDNIWEHIEGKPMKKIGFFIPATKANNEYKEGTEYITNEAKAIKSINKILKQAQDSKDSKLLLTKIINNPMKPSDIFLSKEGTFFNVGLLRECLGRLESDQRLLDSSRKVDLHFDNRGKVYDTPSNKQPIRNFPLSKGEEMDACIEIFEDPKKNSLGEVYKDRYYLSWDTVDDDGNDNVKRSLQSVWVYDTWEKCLVAEYTARTYLASTFYENTRMLTLFYNGRILYELNKKGQFQYFKNKKSLNLLIPILQSIAEKDESESKAIGNKSYGVNMKSRPLKIHAIELLQKWLEDQAYGKEKNVTNAHTIRSVGLLKELIQYNLDINADRVSSLLVMMLLLEDIELQIERRVKRYNNNKENGKKDRDFWKKAYEGENNVLNAYDFTNIN